MKLYLVSSEEPPDEHIDELIIAAATPEEAFERWREFYGFEWKCRVNEIPAVPEESRVMAWNPPSWFGPEDADEG